MDGKNSIFQSIYCLDLACSENLDSRRCHKCMLVGTDRGGWRGLGALLPVVPTEVHDGGAGVVGGTVTAVAVVCPAAAVTAGLPGRAARVPPTARCICRAEQSEEIIIIVYRNSKV